MHREHAILTVDHLTKTFHTKGSELYALQDVSFELQRGEVLGIIGRNGAGKSTLLKVLSRITAPTSGTISYEGELTSIIDVGTGFHSDLTGEENIYLSAQLHGYKREEIKDMYAQIVAFSGLEDFMQMPVKHYSSGMYLRLAFSIAFHSSISILLLDEVIAVGDTDFKRKCYSKLNELKQQGVGIILVSHHLDIIVDQCDRCLLLEDGKIIADGYPLDVANQYHDLTDANEGAKIRSVLSDNALNENFNVLVDLPFVLDHVQLDSINILPEAALDTSTDILVRFTCTKLNNTGSFEIGLNLYNMNNVRVFLDSYAFRADYTVQNMAAGRYEIEVQIPKDLLSPGIYRITVIFSENRELRHELESVAKFKILPVVDDSLQVGVGSIIQPKLNWAVRPIS